MTEKNRILFLSANPWTTSRILVDEEAREIFERIQEGPYRDKFELHKHAATRTVDLQRLLLTYRPHIVHFSGHGSKKQKIILGGTPGRGKTVDQRGLADMFALYSGHVRLVLLNACFTKSQALSISQVIDYSVGTGRGIGDKGGVAFAGAFYRALGFGKSIQEAFQSAKAELGLTKMPRTHGIELFVRDGINKEQSFPRINPSSVKRAPCRTRTDLVCERTEVRSVTEISTYETTRIIRYSRRTGSERVFKKQSLQDKQATNRELVSSQK
ncbi:MAG TPA: CHAT domain-containing protein [Pyrinomonadaceae bacterium]